MPAKKPKTTTGLDFSPTDPAGQEKNQRLFTRGAVVILFGFGVYLSLLYWRHQMVPNPDFSSFVSVGHELLAGRIPYSFKRAPLLGLMQAALSLIVGGRHPDLTAGWLINAVLFPFNVVLLFLVGRFLVGRAAVWLALVCAINPWNITLLPDPIVETTLLFFCLLTFYFMFKRSKWVYLFAAITTLVRYEGAALILAALVMDMLDHRTFRRRAMAMGRAALALLPLVIWLWASLRWDKDTSHYLREGGRRGFHWLTMLSLQWQVSFMPLFIAPAENKTVISVVTFLSQLLAAVGVGLGIAAGLVWRQRKVGTLLIFIVPYLAIHVWHGYLFPRFCATVVWIALLLWLYGLLSWGKWLATKFPLPKVARLILLLFIAAGAALLIAALAQYMVKINRLSPRSTSVAYVAAAVAVLLLCFCLYLDRARNWRAAFTTLLLVVLLITSNQFTLARVVSFGHYDLEFKYLADWYYEHAQPGEIMATNLAGTVHLFIPKMKKNIRGLIKADSTTDFVRKCYAAGITYVVWDYRQGSYPPGRGYKEIRMENIAALAQPRSIAPFQFIAQLKNPHNRNFVNIFRLDPAQKSRYLPPPENPHGK